MSQRKRIMQGLDDLQARRFVGAESRLELIFHQLEETVLFSTADLERRVVALRTQQTELQSQIESIEQTKTAETYTAVQLTERFANTLDLAGGLAGDFRQPEENFKEVARALAEAQTKPGTTKDRMVSQLLDTHDSVPRASNSFRTKVLACSFVLSVLTSLWAQSNSVPLPQRLESLVSARFEGTRCPGLSVAVALNNRIVFSKALGKADLEQDVPLTTASVHRLASLSKPITGTIIMDLVEQGKLALDIPVRQYLPELPMSYQKVTLRHLLSHQSGVRGYADEAAVAFSTTHYATSREALKSVMGYPLMFEPGTKVEYSSLSFTVLGAAAEAVTGRSFQQLSAGFFSKHGISGFALDDPLAIVPKRVRGYLADRNSKIEFNDGRVMTREYLKGTSDEVTLARFYDVSNRYPAGGFDASTEDLLRFVVTVASGKVLELETVEKMWTAQNTSDGTKSVFGLGWGVSRWEEKVKMVGMNGLEPSTTAFLRYFPDSGVGMALVCNAEGAQGLSELVNDILKATVQ